MFDKIGDRAFIAAVTRVREENKDNIAGYRVGVLLRKYASLASVRQRGYGASPRLEDVPIEDRPAFLAELGVPADTGPTRRLSDQISKPANALLIRPVASRWASAGLETLYSHGATLLVEKAALIERHRAHPRRLGAVGLTPP